MGSGTTLLSFELGQNFEVAGVVEESALQVSPRSFLRVPPIAKHDSIASYLGSLERDAAWDIESARNDLQSLYRAHAVRAGSIVIDKGPNASLMRSEFFWACYPEAWTIMIFRDPVANIEGFRRKWRLFGSSDLTESIRFYRTLHECFLDSMDRREGRRVLMLSYESLVSALPEALTVIHERVGLSRASSRPSLHSRPNVPGQGIRNVHDDQIDVVPDANAAAYRNLPEHEIDWIREELGPLYARMMERSAHSHLTRAPGEA